MENPPGTKGSLSEDPDTTKLDENHTEAENVENSHLTENLPEGAPETVSNDPTPQLSGVPTTVVHEPGDSRASLSPYQFPPNVKIGMVIKQNTPMIKVVINSL